MNTASGQKFGSSVDQEEQRPEEKENSDAKTFTINKEASPDANPGDELVFRVVRVHDEELECELAPEGDHKEEDGEEPPPEGNPKGEMDSMM